MINLNKDAKIESAIADKADKWQIVNKDYVDRKFDMQGKIVSGVYQTVKEVSKQASAGTAAAMASAQIPVIQSSQKRNSVGIGFGNYNGESAIAVGVSGVTEDREILYKASLIYDSNDSVGVSAGVAFTFGSSEPHPEDLYQRGEADKRYEQQQVEIKKLNTEKEEQDKRIKSLEDQNEELKKQIQELAALIKSKVN